MEVQRLGADLKYVEINGVTINLEERSRIELSCMQLQDDINQGSIYFWGKIRGKSRAGARVQGSTIRVDLSPPARYFRLSKFKSVR